MNFVIGLDIGQEWIKAVQITDDLKIKKIGKIKVPIDKGQNEEIKQQIYIKEIKELFDTLKFPRENVVINFRGSFILTRTYLPPSPDKEGFEKWFVENIQELVPGTPIEEVVYSYQIFNSGRAIIAFAKLKEIEKQIIMLQNSNIIPSIIDASCLALYDTFIFHPWTKARKNFAILDISNNQGDLLIVKEGEPFSASVVNCRGAISDKKFKDRLVEELGANLVRVFKYLEEKEKIKIKDILIVGDYTKISKLKKNLESLYGFTIELGNPFRHHKFKTSLKYNDKENYSYAQALGLALRGLSKQAIDLIPYEKKKLHKIFFYKKKVEKFAGISLFFAIPVLIVLTVFLILINQNNARLSERINELKNKISELSVIDTRTAILNKKIQRLKELNKNRIYWSEILYELGKDIPEGIYFKDISTDARIVSNGSNAEEKIRVVIDGQSLNQKEVIELINNLENRFKDIAIENIKGETQCEFRISLGL